MQEQNGWINAFTPNCINDRCYLIANYEGWKSLISVSGITSGSQVTLHSEPKQTVTSLYGFDADMEL